MSTIVYCLKTFEYKLLKKKKENVYHANCSQRCFPCLVTPVYDGEQVEPVASTRGRWHLEAVQTAGLKQTIGFREFALIRIDISIDGFEYNDPLVKKKVVGWQSEEKKNTE